MPRSTTAGPLARRRAGDATRCHVPGGQPAAAVRRRATAAAKAIVVAAAVIGAVMAWTASASAASVITARVASPSVDLGQVVYVSGTVSPSTAASRVVVQRGVHGRWSDRQGGAVTAGSFKIGLTPSQAGIYAFRVRSTSGSVISNTVFVKVKLPPSKAIRAVHFAQLDYDTESLCGNGDWVPAPFDQRRVWYGDMTHDGTEEAVIVHLCVSDISSFRFTTEELYGLVGGKPRLLDGIWTIGPDIYNWRPLISSAAISSNQIHLIGVNQPGDHCAGCHVQPVDVHATYANGRLVVHDS